MITALYCLIWTVFSELLVYRYVLDRRDKTIDLCLVNLFTNPLANWTYSHYALGVFSLPFIEVLVVAAEWGMFRWLGMVKPFCLSLLLNLSSLVFGYAALGFL